MRKRKAIDEPIGNQADQVTAIFNSNEWAILSKKQKGNRSRQRKKEGRESTPFDTLPIYKGTLVIGMKAPYGMIHSQLNDGKKTAAVRVSKYELSNHIVNYLQHKSIMAGTT
jgi:hypothetical protein